MKPKTPGLGSAIFVVALLLRVAWVLLRWSRTGAALEFPDEELHWQLASNLVHDGTLVSADARYAARMPGYPLFLALCAWADGTGILIARLLQALLGAATAWIAYAFVSRALDRRAALIAGILVCLDPYAIFFANLLLTEVSFSLFAVALTACAWRLITDPAKASRAATYGVAVCGAAMLMTRPSAAGWLLLLWVVLWLFDSHRVRATRRLGLYVAVMAVCLLPWGLRNRAVIGTSAWLSTNGGVTLYDAQGPQADGSSNQAFLEELPQLAGLDEVGRDRELQRLAAEHMRSNPGRVLELAWVKFRRTWNPVPNVSDYRGGITGFVSAAFTVVTLLLAFIGLAGTLGKKHSAETVPPRRRLHLLLWLPVIYFTLVHCVFIGSLRYRVPLMPFVEIAAATAFVQSRARPSETT